MTATVAGSTSNLTKLTCGKLCLHPSHTAMRTTLAYTNTDITVTTWATATLRAGETLFSFWMAPRPTA